MRKKIIAGNWKMNKNLEEGELLLTAIIEKLKTKEAPENHNFIICPPFTHLSLLNAVIKAHKASLSIGAQNCHESESGAFTGEVSAEMIRSTGAEYVIIGHSERRQYFKESDETLFKKVNSVLKSDLSVIFCCGETLEEREHNRHFEIVKSQLINGLKGSMLQKPSKILIAYEPVWAIGTGKAATAEQANEMHHFIRAVVSEISSEKIANETHILYGGSVKPENAHSLFAMPDIDGALIGGASLKADDFVAISRNASRQTA